MMFKILLSVLCFCLPLKKISCDLSLQVGVISLEKIISESVLWKRALEQLKALEKEYTEKWSKVESKFQEEATAIEEQSKIAKSDKDKKIISENQKKLTDRRANFYSEVKSKSTELQSIQENTLNKIKSSVQKISNKICNNSNMIVISNELVVAYTNNSKSIIDLTSRVTDLLNKEEA